jgi:hypothetical protein
MGGVAVYGALQGVSSAGAGASFLSKFAAGAKGALGALANPIATGKQALGIGAQAAGSASALTGAQGAAVFGEPAGFAELGANVGGQTAGEAGMELLAGGAGEAAAGAGQFAASGGLQAAGTAAVQQAPSASGGLLSRAAKGAWDFAKSPGGSKLIGSVLQGYGEGQAAEEQMKQRWKEQRYYDEQWRDPGQLAKLHGVVGGYAPYTPSTSSGYLSRAQGYQGGYAPGSPEAVAAMARGY